MELDLQLLFFFSSLGVFNGFLLSLYFLIIARPKRVQHFFLGMLLLMLSLRIGKSVLHFFLADLSEVILQIGLSACVFIGPFLWLYIRSVLQQAQAIQKKTYWHLGGLFALVLVVGLRFPYPSRPELWNPEMVQGIYAIWVAYIVRAGFELKDIFGKLIQRKIRLTVLEKWLLVVFVTNALICMVFNSVLYFGFPSYIYGPITFSFVFYILLAFLVFHPDSKTIMEGEKERYANRKIDMQQARQLKVRLEELMSEEQVFKNPELKLKQVATKLSVSAHVLSQFLNDNLGKSFAEYVNEYRVQAACFLLQTDHPLTMEGIGKEVGFKSRTSFYAAFKKRHGITPSQYAKKAKVS